LRQQSIRDPLTRVFNRRYMQETLDRELARAARTQRPVGIVILDIDHFKRVNDTYGHQAGDTVLQDLGQLLLANLRTCDVASRYGGEEFVVVMPDASPEDARVRAETLREKAKALQWRHEGAPPLTITISAGVAAFPADGKTGHVLLRSADAALYRAKEEGRDRVVAV
jgi:diguanylate cyclase (GGDEF)-like protein